jgi:hypothetical protein
LSIVSFGVASLKVMITFELVMETCWFV